MIATGLVLFVLGLLGRVMVQPDFQESMYELFNKEARKKREQAYFTVGLLILIGALILLAGVASWLWKFAP